MYSFQKSSKLLKTELFPTEMEPINVTMDDSAVLISSLCTDLKFLIENFSNFIFKFCQKILVIDEIKGVYLEIDFLFSKISITIFIGCIVTIKKISFLNTL